MAPHARRGASLAFKVALAVGVASLACSRPKDAPSVSEPPAAGFLVRVLDEQSHPVPCRLHLRDGEGNVWTSASWPSFDDHFVFPGEATLPLAPGRYAYEVERGPEFIPVRGALDVTARGRNTLELHLRRLVDLAALGWYAGDLHVHRRPADMPLLMMAEDLRIAPVVTWTNDDRHPPVAWPAVGERIANVGGSRFFDPTAGEDERQGGALLYFGLSKPLELPPLLREDGSIVHRAGELGDEYPSHVELARAARTERGVHIDVEKPFWWDAPSWVALGLADSIGIAHNHMTRASLHNGEAWGKERAAMYAEDPLGDGRWTQDIYYRFLDAGMRLPPSAGSASGVLPNPVGYDRVYVHLGDRLTYDGWWQGLEAGRSFVTNGPLLLVSANGKLPGHVFQSRAGAKVDIAVEARVVANEPMDTIEVVRDGRVVATGPVRADSTPFQLTFEKSGWFLVRTIARRDDNFRFASTAPFYVEVKPNTRRVSRASVQFFVDWTDERMDRLRAGTMPPDKLEAVLQFHREARAVWRRRLSQSNAP